MVRYNRFQISANSPFGKMTVEMQTGIPSLYVSGTTDRQDSVISLISLPTEDPILTTQTKTKSKLR
ncbi:hypothetical protein ACJMK2_020569, partial [Sinanodonta woodiana]